MASNGHCLSELVRDIDDFPTKGVSFRDITPLLDLVRGPCLVIQGSEDAIVGPGAGPRLADALGDRARAALAPLLACLAAPVVVRLWSERPRLAAGVGSRARSRGGVPRRQVEGHRDEAGRHRQL